MRLCNKNSCVDGNPRRLAEKLKFSNYFAGAPLAAYGTLHFLHWQD